MNDLTIVIPAYNEAEALREFLPKLLGYCEDTGCQLIIVNDGSGDDTREVLASQSHHPFFTVLHHKVNRGYGGALKTGILEASTEYVVTIDADGQHRLEDVTALYEAIKKYDADMIVGRRQFRRENLYRETGKAIIRTIAKILMPLEIHDINSGMKIYLTDLVKKYLSLCPDSMAFSDIITLVFLSQRHLVKERDVVVLPRKSGRSTITTKTAIITVLELIHIVVLFNPSRIFLPLSFFFLIFSVTWGTPILLRGEGISTGTLFLFLTGLILFFLGLIAEQLALIRKNQAINP